MDWDNLLSFNSETFWLLLGFSAQGLFAGRFVVQWLYSEKMGKSRVPTVFWFFSLGGGFLLFIYAIKRQDPVFIAGQGLGLLIYVRNIYLVYREKRELKAEAALKQDQDPPRPLRHNPQWRAGISVSA